MRSRRDHYRINDTPERLITPIPLVVNIDKRETTWRGDFYDTGYTSTKTTRVYDPRYLKSFADWLSTAKASAREQHRQTTLVRNLGAASLGLDSDYFQRII